MGNDGGAASPRTVPSAALFDAVDAHEKAVAAVVGPNEAKRLCQPLYDFAWTAQEAPAPEGLRAALVDLTSAYHHERKHEGRWDRCQRPRCQNARLAMEGRGPFAPPTPAEPPRPDYDATAMDYRRGSPQHDPTPAEPPRRLLDALLDKFGSDFDQSVPFEEVLAIVSRAAEPPHPDDIDRAYEVGRDVGLREGRDNLLREQLNRPTLGNRPDVTKPRVAKATRGAKGRKKSHE